MRILRVAQTCYPDVTGGGAYHVHAMSRDQAALGHDVTVLTVRQGAEDPHVEERDGYTVVRFDPTASPLGNDCSAGLARYLHWAVDGDDEGTRAANYSADPAHFDVIHAHSHLYAATNLAAFERWLGAGSPARSIRSLLGSRSPRGPAPRRDHSHGSAPPLAITNHGLYSQAVPERAFELYLRTVGRWTLDRADVVLCYTEVDRRRLRDLGVSTDVAVVPNGVDTERFSPDGPEHPRIAGASPTDDGRRTEADRQNADGPAVLFVGRLVDGKRPGDAIAAIERVRESIPNATLYVCGEGPLRADLEAAADRVDTDAGAGVVFLGHLEYDEMPSVYRAADVLLLPSRAEGMPRTVLEARAAGTPVVASALDQLRALDDDGVRTAPLGDVDALADSIVEVLAGDHLQSAPRQRGSRASMADGGSDRSAGPEHGSDRAAVPLDGVDRSAVPLDGSDRPAMPDDGWDRSTVHDGDGVPAAAEPPPPGEYDWASTVRRTTDVLRDLSEGSR